MTDQPHQLCDDAKHRLRVSKAQRRAMAAEDLKYPVDRLVDFAREVWPPGYTGYRAARCRHFLVQFYSEANAIIRLSIHRVGFDSKTGRWRDGISWDELQHLKSLAGFGDFTAVELYPPADLVVNVANIRHLWVLPAPPPFIWGQR
jgi:hypothetical protein